VEAAFVLTPWFHVGPALFINLAGDLCVTPEVLVAALEQHCGGCDGLLPIEPETRGGIGRRRLPPSGGRRRPCCCEARPHAR
jgi:hypothetical protein